MTEPKDECIKCDASLSINDKPINTIKKCYKTKKCAQPLTIETYNAGHNIKEYKLPELKAACKQYNLKISGTKPILLERLTYHFVSSNAAIIIQKYLRRKHVMQWIKLHGPAFRKISICVNNADFISLEPLSEIDMRYLYSYTDKNNFVYGFDISSLIHSLNNDPKLINPYTRTQFSSSEIDEMIFMYNSTIMLCEDFRSQNSIYRRVNRFVRTPSNTARPRYSTSSTHLINIITQATEESSYANYIPQADPRSILDEQNANRFNRINNIRRQPIPTRIRDVFIEIDRLGNYTNQHWFDDLTHIEYANLYRMLYNIWHYRAGLTRHIQRLICPFYNPFDGIFPRVVRHSEISLTDLKTACLIVFENMIYSGVDDDYRRLGALHALSALTVVSRGARRALPWLYESVI